MKGSMAFTILATLFFLLISGFINTDLQAGKPQKRTYTTYSGSVIFDDTKDIRSDGNPTYADCSITGGEDSIKVDIYDDNYEIRSFNILLGKMMGTEPTEIISNRRLRFCFDVQGEKIEENYTENKAVYDILHQYKELDVYKDRLTANGWLVDGSIHADIYMDYTGKGVIVFVVDPGYEGAKPKAITDVTVNEYRSDDPENLNYKDTSQSGEAGQIFYKITYDAGFSIIEGEAGEWTITPNPTTSRMYVLKYKTIKNGPVSSIVYLATYSQVPSFELNLSVPALQQMAPGKHNTLSELWGRIKSK